MPLGDFGDIDHDIKYRFELSRLTHSLCPVYDSGKGRDKPVDALQCPAPSDCSNGNTIFKLVQSKEAKSFV